MVPAAIARVLAPLRALEPEGTRLVLAVSGGLDSMVLLDAVAQLMPRERLVVATFDHGTGPSATAALGHVRRESGARGLAFRTASAQGLPGNEASWRQARWAFLREVAAEAAAEIATAHTQDDQLETVLMRALRDAGARGLAGIHATPGVRRPLIGLRRDDLAAYAKARGVRWVDDPTNADLRHLRNRLRLELLPALLSIRPELGTDLLRIARDAAEWRAATDALATAACPNLQADAGRLIVAAGDLVGYDPPSLAVLWPSIAGRVGLALDQRGTRRLVAFTSTSAPGSAVPLAGGWEVVRTDETFVLQRSRQAPPARVLPVTDGLHWGRWAFRRLDETAPDDAWAAVLPADRQLAVRSWAPADRVPGRTGPVRVKRVLAEAGIPVTERAGWPVVVADDVIVWIPGVSRELAATARSGRPGVCIRCDPSDG